MEPPARKNRLLAVVAALVLGAGLTASLLRRPPTPDDSSVPVAAPPAAQAAAGAAAPSTETPPPEDHGYIRRLKVVEPPLPGKSAPRAVRGANDVEAETADSVKPISIPAVGPVLPQAGSSYSSSGSGAAPSFGAVGRTGGVPAGAAPPGARRAPSGPGADGKSPGAAPETDAAGFGSASSAALSLVSHARGRITGAAAGGNPLTSAAVAEALRTQIAQDRKADASVREALDGLGPGATPEQQRSAVAAALSAAGEPSSAEDATAAMAKAALPPQPPPSAAAVDDAIRQVSTNLPSAARLDEIAKEAMEPPPKPSGPPPKGGVAAYVQYQDAFDRVEKEDGLEPSKVVPFPAIETSLGANTGKFPLRDTLLAINTDAAGRFKPAQRAQAGRDLVAVTNLLASNDLGGRKVEQLYGSNMGAIGITQFLPSSWAAYGRSMSGGPRDPWNFRDAVLSTGNYLEKHGSRTDYNKAILSYNYSSDYQQKILQYGANVAPGIQAVRQNAAASPPAAPAPTSAAAP